MEEPKVKKKFDKTKILYLIIAILLCFIMYQIVTLDFHKVGNTIAITYNFNISNNPIDK